MNSEGPAPAPGKGRATAALVVACLATLISVAALGIGVGLLREDDDVAMQPAPALTASSSPVAELGPTGSAEPTASAPGWIDPGAKFAPAYADQILRVQLPACGTAVTKYVDLDEPRVGSDVSSAEFYYETRTGCNGSTQLNLLDGVTVTTVPKPAITPAECAEALRKAPANEPIAAAAKLTLCVATSAAKAGELGVPQKIIVLTISVIGADGTATMRANAWDILS